VIFGKLQSNRSLPPGAGLKEGTRPVRWYFSSGAAIQAGKILLIVGLLIVLVGKIGPQNLLAVLATARLPLLALPLILEVSDALLRAYNLSRLLMARGIYLPISSIVYSYMVGGFLGAVIPSSLGTDAARAMSLAKHHNLKLQESVTSLLVLNLIGLFARCVVAAGSSLFMLAEGTNTAIFALTLVFALAYVTVALVGMVGRLPSPSRAKTSAGRIFLERAYRLSPALRSFRYQGKLFGYVALLSLINQLIGIVAFYSVSLALNLSIPIIYFFLFIPIAAIGRLVPASVLGFGAEQGIFVFLFHQVGVAPAEAFAVSLMSSIVSLIMIVLYGFLYLGVTVGSLASYHR
jgi:uncharacterized protein (TIRG00374 family)